MVALENRSHLVINSSSSLQQVWASREQSLPIDLIHISNTQQQCQARKSSVLARLPLDRMCLLNTQHLRGRSHCVLYSKAVVVNHCFINKHMIVPEWLVLTVLICQVWMRHYSHDCSANWNPRSRSSQNLRAKTSLEERRTVRPKRGAKKSFREDKTLRERECERTSERGSVPRIRENKRE